MAVFRVNLRLTRLFAQLIVLIVWAFDMFTNTGITRAQEPDFFGPFIIGAVLTMPAALLVGLVNGLLLKSGRTKLLSKIVAGTLLVSLALYILVAGSAGIGLSDLFCQEGGCAVPLADWLGGLAAMEAALLFEWFVELATINALRSLRALRNPDEGNG